MVSDGESTLTPQYSVDGEDWSPIGEPITELGTNVKVGLKISAGSDAPNVARYDWFRVDCAGPRGAADDGDGDPDVPEGELGWYTTTPTVTLDATDGAAGSGVATAPSTGSARTSEWETYDGPFTVTDARPPHRPVPLERRGRQPRAGEDARAVGRPAGADHDRRLSPPDPTGGRGR